LLYSTLSEARDRIAANRREEIAKMHEDIVDQRAEADHQMIEEIHQHLDEIRTEMMTHVNDSLSTIEKLLLARIETMQSEDHIHIEETHKAVLASVQAHREELADLRELMESTHRMFGGGSPASPEA
jgi:hypothetical protein